MRDNFGHGAPIQTHISSQILSTVADPLKWVVCMVELREVFHNLYVLGWPQSSARGDILARLLHWTQCLGFSIAEEKVELPASRMTFMRVEIDTYAMVLHLPYYRFLGLTKWLVDWWWCTKLVMQHSCKVVCRGRTILRLVEPFITKQTKLEALILELFAGGSGKLHPNNLYALLLLHDPLTSAYHNSLPTCKIKA